MPVTGLVAHLTADPRAWPRAIERLAADPRVTLGPQEGAKLALVTETERADEDAELFTELARIEGVLSIFVVFHDFSDVGGVEGTVPRRWGRT